MEYDKNMRRLESSKTLLEQYEQKLKSYLGKGEISKNAFEMPSYKVKTLDGISKISQQFYLPKPSSNTEKEEESKNFFTTARKRRELKDRLDRYRAIEVKNDYKPGKGDFFERDPNENFNPYPKPYYRYLTNQLANEALVYENRKMEYQDIVEKQRREIESLKKKLKEKQKVKILNGRSALRPGNDLVEKLKQLKINYRNIRDMATNNEIMFRGIRSNRQLSSSGFKSGRAVFGTSSMIENTKERGVSEKANRTVKRKISSGKGRGKSKSKSRLLKGGKKKRSSKGKSMSVSGFGGKSSAVSGARKKKRGKKGKGDVVNPILKLIQAYNY